MKKIIYLKNAELAAVSNALYKIVCDSAKTNRGKFKLLDLLSRKFEEYKKDSERIIEDYAVKDEKGDTKTDKIIIRDGFREVAESELKELANEKVAILYGEYSELISNFIEYVNDYEGDIDAEVGQGLFVIQEAFEAQEEG